MKLSPTMRHINTVSEIDAPIERVWAAVTSPDGINHELRPYLRMTVPRPFRGVTIDDIAPGTKLGRSVFLLFGVLPFDYDNITVAEIDRGKRFLENSTMMSMSTWIHERTLRPLGDRTEVSDAVSFVARPPLGVIPGWSQMLRFVLGFLFRHRHRRLKALFDGDRQALSKTGGAS